MKRISTGAALRTICRRQLEQFLALLPEVVAGRDPEALHDLRVAVRRTRTVLGEFKASFPVERRQWLREELRWLGTVTGPVRDLDVYLEHLATYARRLTEEDATGLAPLRQLLLARRRVERRRLLRGLKSARLAGLLAGWQRLSSGADASDWPPAAALPADEAARRRTWKLYRRFLRQGAAIAGDSPDEHVHRLRITGKKLRYLVEFFRDLHPATEIAVLVKAMKGIQDHLGAFQDLSVQRQALAGSREQLAAAGCLTPATARAISLLAEILHREQLRVRRQIPERFRVFTRGRGRRGLIRLYAPQRNCTRDCEKPMKRLTLVRHAKSSWEKLALADLERPLTRRGRQDAEHMGAWLAEGGDAPDIILVSPARRTRKTAKRLVAALPGCAERILVDPALYAADAGLLLQRLRHLDESWRHVMLIAHNPGLLDLVNELTGAGLEKLPTCSVALVDLTIDSWAAAAPATGMLALLMTPKRLARQDRCADP